MTPFSQPSDRNAANRLAIRAAFLEAFARELARDMPDMPGVARQDVGIAACELIAEIEVSENGYRPVNRLLGLV